MRIDLSRHVVPAAELVSSQLRSMVRQAERPVGAVALHVGDILGGAARVSVALQAASRWVPGPHPDVGAFVHWGDEPYELDDYWFADLEPDDHGRVIVEVELPGPTILAVDLNDDRALGDAMVSFLEQIWNQPAVSQAIDSCNLTEADAVLVHADGFPTKNLYG